MKAISLWLNRIYTAYAILVFVLPIVIVLPIHLLLTPLATRTRLRTVYRVHRAWVWCWEQLTGVHFRVSGREHLDPTKTYVFVANHTNALDIPLVGSYLIHPWVSLVKKELPKVPLVGWVIALIAIPVDRSSLESRKISMRRMVSTLHQGISILVFPEGTRNRTPYPVKRFFSGAFSTAIKAQVPILPLVITHSRPLQPAQAFELHPGTCYLHLLPEVSTEGLSEKDADSLRQTVQQQIEAVIVAKDPMFSSQTA